LVAPLWKSADETRLAGYVSESFAQFEDVRSEDFGLDIGFWPDGFEQFLLGNKAAGMVNEVAEDGESFRRKVNADRFPPEALIDKIEPEGREDFSRRIAHASFDYTIAPQRDFTVFGGNLYREFTQSSRGLHGKTQRYL